MNRMSDLRLLRWPAPFLLCARFTQTVTSGSSRCGRCDSFLWFLLFTRATTSPLRRRLLSTRIIRFLFLYGEPSVENQERGRLVKYTLGGLPLFFFTGAPSDGPGAADAAPDFLFLLPLGRPRPLLAGCASLGVVAANEVTNKF